jgi:hypothetical protein
MENSIWPYNQPNPRSMMKFFLFFWSNWHGITHMKPEIKRNDSINDNIKHFIFWIYNKYFFNIIMKTKIEKKIGI